MTTKQEPQTADKVLAEETEESRDTYSADGLEMPELSELESTPEFKD